MRRLIVGMAATVALAMSAAPSAAQLRFGAGAALGTDSDFGLTGRLLAGLGGAQVAEKPLQGLLAVDWFLDPCEGGVDCTWIEVTPAVFVPFAGSSVQPYAGAGLNVARLSVDVDVPGVDDTSETEVGLALLGGLFVPLGSLTGMGEARLSVGGSEQLVLSFSILFGGRGNQ